MGGEPNPATPAGNAGQISKDERSALVTFQLAGDFDVVSDRVDAPLKTVATVAADHPGLRIEQFGDASAGKAQRGLRGGLPEGRDALAADHAAHPRRDDAARRSHPVDGRPARRRRSRGQREHRAPDRGDRAEPAVGGRRLRRPGLVFQAGHGEGLPGFESTGSISSWLPLFVFVILFGLSMDYHVFILSRTREAFDSGMRTEEAVAHAIK